MTFIDIILKLMLSFFFCQLYWIIIIIKKQTHITMSSVSSETTRLILVLRTGCTPWAVLPFSPEEQPESGVFSDGQKNQNGGHISLIEPPLFLHAL